MEAKTEAKEKNQAKFINFVNLVDKMKHIQAELGDKCVFTIAVETDDLEILRIDVLDKEHLEMKMKPNEQQNEQKFNMGYDNYIG